MASACVPKPGPLPASRRLTLKIQVRPGRPECFRPDVRANHAADDGSVIRLTHIIWGGEPASRRRHQKHARALMRRHEAGAGAASEEERQRCAESITTII